MGTEMGTQPDVTRGELIALLQDRIARIERRELPYLHLFASENWSAAAEGAQEPPWIVVEAGEPFVMLRTNRQGSDQTQDKRTPFRGTFAIGPKQITHDEMVARLRTLGELLSLNRLERVNVQIRQRSDTPSEWDAIFESRFMNNYSVFGEL